MEEYEVEFKITECFTIKIKAESETHAANLIQNYDYNKADAMIEWGEMEVVEVEVVENESE